VTMRGGLGLTDEQLLTSKIVTIAADPPPEVGRLQRRTSEWLLRYPRWDSKWQVRTGLLHIQPIDRCSRPSVRTGRTHSGCATVGRI
jgi:hypothetical protein